MNTLSTKIVQTIIAHLKSENKLELLGEVVEGLKNSQEYKNSRHHVKLVSAEKLDAATSKSIKSYLDKSIGSEYELTSTVDPSLLAGFTLQIDGTLIDASVLGKINTVSNILTAKE